MTAELKCSLNLFDLLSTVVHSTFRLLPIRSHWTALYHVRQHILWWNSEICSCHITSLPALRSSGHRSLDSSQVGSLSTIHYQRWRQLNACAWIARRIASIPSECRINDLKTDPDECFPLKVSRFWNVFFQTTVKIKCYSLPVRLIVQLIGVTVRMQNEILLKNASMFV